MLVELNGVTSMIDNVITNLVSPSCAKDEATKRHVDSKVYRRVRKAGDTMTGALAIRGNPITDLANPSYPQDAATKIYLDSLRVLKVGDTDSCGWV